MFMWESLLSQKFWKIKRAQLGTAVPNLVAVLFHSIKSTKKSQTNKMIPHFESTTWCSFFTNSSNSFYTPQFLFHKILPIVWSFLIITWSKSLIQKFLQICVYSMKNKYSSISRSIYVAIIFKKIENKQVYSGLHSDSYSKRFYCLCITLNFQNIIWALWSNENMLKAWCLCPIFYSLLKCQHHPTYPHFTRNHPNFKY